MSIERRNQQLRRFYGRELEMKIAGNAEYMFGMNIIDSTKLQRFMDEFQKQIDFARKNQNVLVMQKKWDERYVMNFDLVWDELPKKREDLALDRTARELGPRPEFMIGMNEYEFHRDVFQILKSAVREKPFRGWRRLKTHSMRLEDLYQLNDTEYWS